MTQEITAQIALTPEQVAEGFWHLDAEQQAAFFAHLSRIAPPFNLCMQMLATTKEVADLAERGEYDAMHGLHAFRDDADRYHDTAAWHRGEEAKRVIAGIAGARA